MNRAELERQLALYKAAFEEATAGGRSESYEGWGGIRTRHVGETQLRDRAMAAAVKRISDA